MATKTAICQTVQGQFVPVHCKLWENETGVTSLERTKAQLYRDYPSYRLMGWVQDLEDIESIKMLFLSPNVMFKYVWAETEAGYERVKVNRDLTVETL